MAAIWRTGDRRGREVALEAGWAHILAKHGDMAGREVDVRSAVEAPDFVNRDAAHPRREIFYLQAETGRWWLRVVVNYLPVPPQGTGAGEIITAHRTSIRRRFPKEKRLWP